jgi:hypothetical protein|tara:strand:- start:2259 stop:2405 length:147 start_codon:yes stop_codon:yes gene_type:complete
MTSYTKGRFQFIAPDSWSEKATKEMGEAILKEVANQKKVDKKTNGGKP